MNTHKIAISKYLILTVAFAFFCLSSYIVLAHGSDYRSDVANVAGKLKEVAGKDKNIGEEISQIAKEQEEAVEEVESAKEAVEENPVAAGDYKKGKQNALQFLIGQTMKKLKGQANPGILRKLFEDYLSR